MAAEHAGGRREYRHCGRCPGRSGVASRFQMPSLFRLLFVLGLMGGFVYGAIFSLARFVEPKPREITVTIPQDKLAKPR